MMNDKTIKIYPNYFYSLRLICLAIGIGVFPSFVVTQYSFKNIEYKIVLIILLMLISLLILIYAVLRLFLSYISIDRNNLIIKTMTKKIIIPIKDIDNIQNYFRRGNNTSFLGKTTYEIRTISKTYKINSDQYRKLEKLDNYLKLQEENKE